MVDRQQPRPHVDQRRLTHAGRRHQLLGRERLGWRPDQARQAVVLRQRAQVLRPSAPVPGAFANLYAGDATKWTYAKNPNVDTRGADSRNIYSLRLTGQVTPRNRVSFSHEYQYRCSGSTLTPSGSGCRVPDSNWVGVGTLTSSPETFPGYHHFPYNVTQATWSSPVTNKLLLEAGFSRFQYLWAGFGQVPPDGLTNLIPVQEQSAMYGQPNFIYRGLYDPLGFAYADNDANPNNWRATASYVTGAHNMKFGYQGSFQKSAQGRVANQTQLEYRFNNGVPNAVSYYLAPRWEQNDRTETTSLFAQDQWTRGRLTLQGGVRYDRAWSWAPAEGNGTSLTSRFNPQPISFPETISVKGYNDITPRIGAAYDRVWQRQDRHQGERRQVPAGGHQRRELLGEQPGRQDRDERGESRVD